MSGFIIFIVASAWCSVQACVSTAQDHGSVGGHRLIRASRLNMENTMRPEDYKDGLSVRYFYRDLGDQKNVNVQRLDGETRSMICDNKSGVEAWMLPEKRFADSASAVRCCAGDIDDPANGALLTIQSRGFKAYMSFRRDGEKGFLQMTYSVDPCQEKHTYSQYLDKNSLVRWGETDVSPKRVNKNLPRVTLPQGVQKEKRAGSSQSVLHLAGTHSFCLRGVVTTTDQFCEVALQKDHLVIKRFVLKYTGGDQFFVKAVLTDGGARKAKVQWGRQSGSDGFALGCETIQGGWDVPIFY